MIIAESSPVPSAFLPVDDAMPDAELPSTVHADTLIHDPWEQVERTHCDGTPDAARSSWDGFRLLGDYAINRAAEHRKVLQRNT